MSRTAEQQVKEVPKPDNNNAASRRPPARRVQEDRKLMSDIFNFSKSRLGYDEASARRTAEIAVETIRCYDDE